MSRRDTWGAHLAQGEGRHLRVIAETKLPGEFSQTQFGVTPCSAGWELGQQHLEELCKWVLGVCRTKKAALGPPRRSAVSPAPKDVHCITKEQKQREESGKGANELRKEEQSRWVDRSSHPIRGGS